MRSRRRPNRASGNISCVSLRVAGCGSERLEDRSLLSNLAITDAYLVDGTGAKITSPVLGEQLEVRAAYSTDSLSVSAAYAIRVIVDGVAVDRSGVTFGAGIVTGTWLAGVFHGYAEAGPHSVQVILDSLNQVSEVNESDNTLTFSMTPVSAANLPQKLGSFVSGTAGVDWRIVNFADLDPRPGMLRDYKGGKFTYDLDTGGHDAIDLGTGQFAATDREVGIYAAAAGVVSSIHDGEYDRNTGFADPAPPANYVIVDHGNGWQTWYWHLRRDSVSVKVGDPVNAGDLLGWMGSSGFSTGPHVHFAVEYRNHTVETMLDPATYWITPPAYPADYRHAISSGLSSLAPTASEWNERPQDMRVFKPGNSVYFWVIAGAMLPGDIRTIRYLRPDGTTFFEQDYNQGTAFYNASQWYYFVTLPANAPLGTWTTSWLQNGVELARESFTVATTGAPAIRVDQGTQYIQSERFTPIDFGTVAANAAAPTQSFTITNQGSAPLTLGAVSLPTGYQLATTPATTVAPGQTTTLVVRLLTTMPGYYGGELRMTTNDADTPVFRIWLEGVVETTGVGTLIPGISVRNAAEGSRFYANVRRTGSTAAAVTVTLTTDASELQVPATVTIPAGASFVNFEVQAVQDFTTDGDQRIQLRASATGLIQGQNELLIEDVFVGQIIVSETSGSTNVSEDGTTDQVTVVLSAQPVVDVVINVNSDDIGEVTAQPKPLIFTPVNWSTPQVVTISAIDDNLLDGTRTTNVRLAVDPVVSDSAYKLTPNQAVSVTSIDNDVAGFEVQQSGGTTIAREQSFTDSMQIRLKAQPTSNVVLSVSNPNPGELTISSTTVTFTPQQWNVWHQITFAAVADGVMDGDQSNAVTITLVGAASDPAFAAVPGQTITVITEDLRPEFRVNETGGQTLVRENGASDSLSIVLTAQPVSPVVVRAQLPVNAEITPAQMQWTFDSSNWNIPQTVFVSAIDDVIEESNETFAITFFLDLAVSDAAFQFSPSLIVDVTVEDDEPLPTEIQGTTGANLGTPFTLSWTPVTGAVDYELWVNFVSGGVAQIVHTNVANSSYDFTGFNEMGTYRAWVRANVNSGFTTRWSLPHDVRVAGLIALQPMPRYVDSAAPTFQWNAVPTAVRYDLWVDDVRNGISQLIRKTDIVTTSFTVPTSLPMSLYRVWVRAIDARGQSTSWSIRNEFFITPRPSTTPTPVSTFDRTPTLQWDAVKGARSYEIWVRNAFTGADPYRVNNIQQPEWTVPANLSAGPYQWWVRGFSDFGVIGLWSVARDLYVGGRPTLLAPVVNPGLPVAFVWTPVQGAFIYQLQVDRLDIPQVRVVREENLLAATWQTPGALAVGAYRVWVRAVSTSGEFSNWSRSLDFLVTEVNPVESQLKPELVSLDLAERHSEAVASTASSGNDDPRISTEESLPEFPAQETDIVPAVQRRSGNDEIAFDLEEFWIQHGQVTEICNL